MKQFGNDIFSVVEEFLYHGLAGPSSMPQPVLIVVRVVFVVVHKVVVVVWNRRTRMTPATASAIEDAWWIVIDTVVLQSLYQDGMLRKSVALILRKDWCLTTLVVEYS